MSKTDFSVLILTLWSFNGIIIPGKVLTLFFFSCFMTINSKQNFHKTFIKEAFNTLLYIFESDLRLFLKRLFVYSMVFFFHLNT